MSPSPPPLQGARLICYPTVRRARKTGPCIKNTAMGSIMTPTKVCHEREMAGVEVLTVDQSPAKTAGGAACTSEVGGKKAATPSNLVVSDMLNIPSLSR